jgi:hypothetical protein
MNSFKPNKPCNSNSYSNNSNSNSYSNNSNSNSYSSNFKIKTTAPIIANFNLDAQIDFPDLFVSKSITNDVTGLTQEEKTNNDAIDYKNAVKTDNAILEDVDPNLFVAPGWVKYTLNKQNKIISVVNGQSKNNKNSVKTAAINEDEKKKNKDLTYFNELSYKLEENWIKYTENYIEIYGYDYYEHNYLMPNYFASTETDSENDYSDNDYSNNNEFDNDY